MEKDLQNSGHLCCLCRKFVWVFFALSVINIVQSFYTLHYCLRMVLQGLVFLLSLLFSANMHVHKSLHGGLYHLELGKVYIPGQPFQTGQFFSERLIDWPQRLQMVYHLLPNKVCKIRVILCRRPSYYVLAKISHLLLKVYLIWLLYLF
jgi:hypothetical protein